MSREQVSVAVKMTFRGDQRAESTGRLAFTAIKANRTESPQYEHLAEPSD